MLDNEILSMYIHYRYALSYDGIGFLNKGEVMINVMLFVSSYYAYVHNKGK